MIPSKKPPAKNNNKSVSPATVATKEIELASGTHWAEEQFKQSSWAGEGGGVDCSISCVRGGGELQKPTSLGS